MQATRNRGTSDQQLTVTIEGLMERLACGRKTADTIGKNAQAKIRIGKRVFYSLPKIEKYLEEICE